MTGLSQANKIVKFGIQQPIRLSGIKPLIALLAVLLAPLVSEAGLMTAPFDPDSIAIYAASAAPTPDAPDEESQHVQSCGQKLGMTSSSSGERIHIFVVSYFGHQSAQPDLVQWLVSQSRLVIPSPIPIGLLKVPIEVV